VSLTTAAAAAAAAAAAQRIQGGRGDLGLAADADARLRAGTVESPDVEEREVGSEGGRREHVCHKPAHVLQEPVLLTPRITVSLVWFQQQQQQPPSMGQKERTAMGVVV